MSRTWLWLLLSAPVSAHAGVVINEVLFDPDSAGGDAGYEWFELYNDGTATEDLAGWTVQAGTSSFSTVITFEAGTTIAPGGYLLVGDSNVPATDVYTAMSLGNASSSGDAIQLLDATSSIVDVVVYGPDNSDGWTDEAGVAVASTAAKGPAGSSIARLPDGQDTGDLAADFGVATTPTPGATNGQPAACEADPGGVVINEFLVDPAGTDGTVLLEWVEIYAPSAFSLAGWTVERFSQADNYATVFQFDATHSVASGDYFLLGEPNVPAADALTSGSMGLYGGTTGDGIRLLDCEGSVVDTVVYGPPNDDGLVDDSGLVATSIAPDPASDQALARAVNGLDTDRSGDDFVIATTPTPGAANPTVTPPTCVGATPGAVTINEFRPDPAGSDSEVLLEFIELHASGSATLDGWRLERFSQADNFSTTYSFPSGTSMGAGSFLVVGESNVAEADLVTGATLGLYGGSGGDGIRLVDCNDAVVDTVIYGPNNDNGLIDDTGQVASSIAPSPGSDDVLARREDGIDTDDSGVDFWVTGTATPGTPNPTPPPPPVCTAWDGSTGLVINEFLADPAGADGDALLEWVEIFNPAGVGIDLEGWTIERFSNPENASAAVTLPSGTVIGAGGFLLIGEANVPGANVVVDGTIGLYSGTGGDGLRLVDCEGTVLDTVVYGTSNDDQLIDDTGAVAVSLAPDPGSDQAVARVADGLDTNLCGVDFVLAGTPTPGQPNPEIVCEASPGTVVINEFLSDPAGTDSEAATEFIEVYNRGTGPVSLDGWYLVAGGQDDDASADIVFPPETSIGAEGFFVVGNFNVAEADIVDVFSIPNGSGGDFIRLYDCEGALVDTVVYGGENTDGIVDDLGVVEEFVSDAPDDDQALARVEDGVDTNSRDDWFLDGSPTPGFTNYQEPYIPPEESGCNRRNNRPGAGNSPGGCAVSPLPMSAAWLPMVLALGWRRRR